MLVQTASVGPWGTNCHVVALERGGECIVIDPGLGAADYVLETTAELKLKPVAILATHGHVDHVWNLYPLASDLNIPAAIHQQDRRFLTDPILAISPETANMVQSLTPNQRWQEPTEVLEVSDGMKINFAGFEIEIIETPGHTAGSICFQIGATHLFTGDLLFKRAIGRTDLFSGDSNQMQNSLKLIMSRFNDEVLLFPGHGENTDIGYERLNNPYLKDLLEI